MGAVHRLRRHGHRRGSGRLHRRPRGPQNRVHRHTDYLRHRQRCHGPILVTRHAARRPTDHRTGLGRGTAGRLHAGLRVFADQTARPHDCAAGIVLGRRLDRRRHDRLLRDPEHRRLGLALGAGHRRAATALRNRHPRAHPRIRAIPRSQGSRRRSRKGRALLRGSRGSSPGNLSQGQAAAEDQDARTVRLQVPGPHHRHLGHVVLRTTARSHGCRRCSPTSSAP